MSDDSYCNYCGRRHCEPWCQKPHVKKQEAIYRAAVIAAIEELLTPETRKKIDRLRDLGDDADPSGEYLTADEWRKAIMGIVIRPALASWTPPAYGSDVLCPSCAVVFCPHGERLHFDKDGCPACEFLQKPRKTYQKKGYARGSHNGNAKLTEEIVAEIRATPLSVSHHELSRSFGVSPVTIRSIRLGKTWRLL